MITKKSLIIGLLSTSIIAAGIVGGLAIADGPNETKTIPNKVNNIAVTTKASDESNTKETTIIEEQSVTTTEKTDDAKAEKIEEAQSITSVSRISTTTSTTKAPTTETDKKVVSSTTTTTKATTIQPSRDYHKEALWVQEQAISYGKSIGLEHMTYLDRTCNYRTGYNGYIASWSTKEEALTTEKKALDELKAKGCLGFNIIVMENEYGNGGWQCCACGG